MSLVRAQVCQPKTMLTVDYVKTLAFELASHSDERLSPVVKILLDLADQLEYLEERDTVTDSRIQLLRSMDDNCKEELRLLNGKLLQLQDVNIELRKQVDMLKKALVA